jgi:hypothetical protein
VNSPLENPTWVRCTTWIGSEISRTRGCLRRPRPVKRREKRAKKKLLQGIAYGSTTIPDVFDANCNSGDDSSSIFETCSQKRINTRGLRKAFESLPLVHGALLYDKCIRRVQPKWGPRKNGREGERTGIRTSVPMSALLYFFKRRVSGVVSETHRRHAVDTRMGHDEQTTLHCMW